MTTGNETINPAKVPIEQLSRILTETQVAKVTPDEIEGFIDDGLPATIDGEVNLINVLAYMITRLDEGKQ